MKTKVYMLCDGEEPDSRLARQLCCFGRIVHEDGTVIGGHCSSSFGWLRQDLKRKLDDPDKYEIVDLIGQPVPERFRSPPEREERG